jgi:hypothetical protein
LSRALLDVNVLLALLDSDHIDHEQATDWLDGEIRSGWASCGIGVQSAAGCGAADAPATPRGGVAGDGLGPGGRAAGEESCDLASERSLVLEVLSGTALGIPALPQAPGLLVGQALLLGS